MALFSSPEARRSDKEAPEPGANSPESQSCQRPLQTQFVSVILLFGSVIRQMVDKSPTDRTSQILVPVFVSFDASRYRPTSTYPVVMGLITTAALALAAVVAFPATAAAAEEQKPLSSDYTCTHPPYKIQMVAKSPLVIYISDFVTSAEREHLLGLA